MYLTDYNKILRIDEDCFYESDYNNVFNILYKLSCTLLEGTWSHLMNRRFVDVSVESIDKLSAIEDYRLMCYELVDFIS